jgi:hypothetical protein
VRDQPSTSRSACAVASLVLALVLAVYLTTAGGSLATTDAVATYEVTRQLVEQRTVALPADIVGNEAFKGPDGRLYSPFGLLQSVWNVPFYGTGLLVAALPPFRAMSPVMLTKATVALGNAVAAALCVWTVWWLAWSVSGRHPGTATTAALLAAFATSLWPYSKFGFNVPMAAWLVTAAVLAWTRASESRSARWAWAAGAACGLALLTRHELALLALPSLVVLAWGWPRGWARRTGWWAAGAAPPAAVWLWYNHVRFGSAFETGYLRDDTIGMGSSLAEGLWGLLLSPGASIFLYSPVAVAAIVALVRLRRQHPRLVWQVAGLVCLFTLFYAQMAGWAGGRSYGPRYLVVFLPVLCVPLACWLPALSPGARRWAAAWCAISVLVQMPGVLVDFAKVRVAYARQFQDAPYEARMHTWEGCPLVLNTKAAAAAVPATVRHLTGLEPKPVIDQRPEAHLAGVSEQLAFSVDFWWVSLFYLGVVPGAVSMLTGAVLLLVAGLAGAVLWAALRRLPPQVMQRG